MLKDANGCFAGYRCANGANPCKVAACSTSEPCPSGQTCRDMLCWPNDGGTGGTGGTTAPGCGYQCQTVGGVTGWYLHNQLVCEADCRDCTVSCENVGTRSEGCWSSCGGNLSAGCASSGREGLINYSFCSDPYAAGYLAWYNPDPATGIGPAVVVSATGGWMQAWAAIGTFEPENVPSNPSTTMEFDRARLNDLFSRLAALDLASLPHAPVTGPEKCRPNLYFRLCAGCTAKTLSYPAVESVSPEMNEVWAWFDSIVWNARDLVVNPHRFCESGG